MKKVVSSYDQALDKKLTLDDLKAISLSMIRIPLAFIGIIASLDNCKQMFNEVDNRGKYLDWSLKMIEDLDIWRIGLI